ncbi:DNRLRE domain-containing protein [Lacihabitans sp. CCS-44]|uniref:DNRLRE domain-containing protein n=1 Tax=Lacihabitans sp. CCS-44 TaxID=2487331 RepID=UPI0020CF41CC|nr:DNRLRE domain-containing protein [Lacihabitans sp. CCS-44]MCP9754791.1 DNRLRE domain-containing protein [Lacihabitans sp. CCS-44]
MKRYSFLLFLSISLFTTIQVAIAQKEDADENFVSSNKSVKKRQMIFSDHVGNDIFLKGSFLEMGIASNGCLMSSSAPPLGYNNTPSSSGKLSIVYDPGNDGWGTGTPSKSGDYFKPGSAFEGFQVQYNSEVYSNNVSGDFQIPGNNISLTETSDSHIAVWEGMVLGKFSIKQTLEIKTNGTHAKLSVEITNLSTTNANIYYSRAADPDQEFEITGIFETNNTIVSQYSTGGSGSLVKALGTANNIYFGFGSSDPRSKVAISYPWRLAPADYYTGLNGAIITGGNNLDHAISLTFYEPNVVYQQKIVFEGYILLNPAEENIALCKPSGSIAAEKTTIYEGQSTNLVINLGGIGPWTFNLNNQIYNTSISPFVLSVNPTTSTEYLLKNVSNSCGTYTEPKFVTVTVLPCNIPTTATLSGSTTVPLGSSTNLTVNLTGYSPWNFKLNGVSYSTTTTPYIIPVSPTVNTNYLLSDLNNYCGSGTVSGSVNINVTIACDANEPNNSLVQATTINSLPFQSNQMCFHVNTDEDWFKFDVNGRNYFIKSKILSSTATGNYKLNALIIGGVLTIETIPFVNSNLDTELFLYESDGTTQLAYDDDNGLGAFSKIMFNICPNNIVHNINTTINGTFSAFESISSQSLIANRTEYFAGKHILLMPGFKTDDSQLFLAQIKSCESKNITPAVQSITLQPGLLDGQDGEVNSLYPDVISFNGQSKFLSPAVWTYSGNLNIKRAYLKFDLSSLPVGATIDSAHLDLFFSQELLNTYPYFSGQTGHSGTNSFLIKRAVSNWDESTLTWNSKPSTSELNAVTIATTSIPTQDFLKINVKNILTDILASSNHGFEIRMVDESVYKSLCLTSSEEVNPLIRPKLTIYYH